MYGKGFSEIATQIQNTLGKADTAAVAFRCRELVDQGVPRELAERVALMPYMASAPDIVRVAEATKRHVKDAGKVYFAIGHRLSLDWCRQAAENVKVSNHWQRLAARAIVDNFYGNQRLLTQAIIDSSTVSTTAENMTETWLSDHTAQMHVFDEMLEEFKSTTNLDLAMLSIAENRIQTLTDTR